MEALACGRTVVSTDVGQASKLVTPGVTGVIVARTVGDLAHGILTARAMGNRSESCRRSMAAWDWRKMALAYGPVLGEPQ